MCQIYCGIAFKIRLNIHNVVVKKRMVNTECRVFQEKWTASHVLTYVDEKSGFAMVISVVKEHIIRRHYHSYHSDKFRKMHGKQGRTTKKIVLWSKDKVVHFQL